MQVEKRKYSKETVDQWYNYLINNHTLKETSEYFNISYYSLVKILTRYGYRKVAYKVKNITWRKNENINYFNVINSHEKAYFLGFIYADGSISSNINTNNKTFNFTLQLQDKYILDKLHNNMNLKTKIIIHKNSAKLHVYNQELYNDLINLGIKEDKSHKDFLFPNIDEKYIPSFILGYFDGDGCISLKSNNNASVSITCNSEIFLLNMKKYLDKENIKCYIRKIKKIKNYLYVLYVSGKENHIKFKNYIYKDSNIFLIRKHNKFLTLWQNFVQSQEIAEQVNQHQLEH